MVKVPAGEENEGPFNWLGNYNMAASLIPGIEMQSLLKGLARKGKENDILGKWEFGLVIMCHAPSKSI